jgi:hypothetical protein
MARRKLKLGISAPGLMGREFGGAAALVYRRTGSVEQVRV